MGLYSDVSLVERTRIFLERPAVLEEIIASLANGGSILEMCDAREIRYSDVLAWIHKDKDRHLAYKAALIERNEWAVQRVFDEIRRIATVDIRQAFDKDGKLLPIQDIPADVAKSITKIVETPLRGRKDKKVEIRFADKIKALELLGKEVDMFHTKIDVTSKSLGDLVEESFQKKTVVRGDLEPKEN